MLIIRRADLTEYVTANKPALADTTITMPKGAVVRWVRVHLASTVAPPDRPEVASLYYECDAAQSATELRLFRVVPTDVAFDPSGMTYVGSFLLREMATGHVYEVTKATK